MIIPISEHTLMARLVDPETPLEEILPYFALDESASDAFAPRFWLHENTVVRELELETAQYYHRANS